MSYIHFYLPIIFYLVSLHPLKTETITEKNEFKQFAIQLNSKKQTEFNKNEVIDGWASGLKEIKGSPNSIFAERIFKQKNGTMYIDIINKDNNSKYDQLNKVVQFDGKILKWNYSGYYCLSTPDLKEFYPCETKFNFTGTVVSTNPLILDVITIEKTWGTGSTSESKSQWIFNK